MLVKDTLPSALVPFQNQQFCTSPAFYGMRIAEVLSHQAQLWIDALNRNSSLGYLVDLLNKMVTLRVQVRWSLFFIVCLLFIFELA